MSVVRPSQFSLIRSRRALEKACRQHDWAAVRSWDLTLAQAMDAVLADPERDTKALLAELEAVLATYRRIVAELPEECLQHLPLPQGSTDG